MGIKMFNDDQKSWMADLKALPDKDKCFCGWDKLGKCFLCNRVGEHRNFAERRKISCHDCFTATGVHRIGCKHYEKLSYTL